MGIIYEAADSRGASIDGSGASLTLRWVVRDETEETGVLSLVLAASPIVADGLVRNGITWTPQGGGVWYAEVTYGRVDINSAVGTTPTEPTAPAPTEPLMPSPGGAGGGGTPAQGFQISFDTSGQTRHLTQSVNTSHAVKRGGGVAPDFKRAIGVGKDGVVNGVDVFAPKLELSITVTRADVTMQYIDTLVGLTAKTNSFAWWGFAAGEALYLGATGQYAESGRWSVTHRVAVEKNQVGVVVCDGLTLPSVGGWDYVWFTYSDEVNAGELVQAPSAGYVEQVYREADFAALGIGS